MSDEIENKTPKRSDNSVQIAMVVGIVVVMCTFLICVTYLLTSGI